METNVLLIGFGNFATYLLMSRKLQNMVAIENASLIHEYRHTGKERDSISI